MSNITVQISDKTITNGLALSLEESKMHPKIFFNRFPDENFTILVVDPDAPSRENPEFRYFLHLLIINNDIEIVPYEPPNPPSNTGFHRYFFCLYKQKFPFNKEHMLILPNKKNDKITRANFNLNEFSHVNHLTLIDSVYFQTENK